MSQPNQNIEKLYKSMVSEYCDNRKIKKITDDLVVYYDEGKDTYYVNFHAKDFELDETKLTHLTKKVLNNVSHTNRYNPSPFEDKSINKRWI